MAGFLARPPGGGWLPHEQTAELLGCYGVPLADPDGALAVDGRVRIQVAEPADAHPRQLQ